MVLAQVLLHCRQLGLSESEMILFSSISFWFCTICGAEAPVGVPFTVCSRLRHRVVGAGLDIRQVGFQDDPVLGGPVQELSTFMSCNW